MADIKQALLDAVKTRNWLRNTFGQSLFVKWPQTCESCGYVTQKVKSGASRVDCPSCRHVQPIVKGRLAIKLTNSMRVE